MQISSLRNIGALFIFVSAEGIESATVDDRIVRAWSDAAVEGTAFEHLKVLFLSQQDVSFRSWPYLEQFPSLCHVALIYNWDNDLSREVCPPGWERKTGIEIYSDIRANGLIENPQDTPLYAHYREASVLAKALGCIDHSETSILDFHVGNRPRAALFEEWKLRKTVCLRRLEPFLTKRQLQDKSLQHATYRKRLAQAAATASAIQIKKRMIRTAKAQDIGDLLNSFS